MSQFFAALPADEVGSAKPSKCIVDGLSILLVRDSEDTIFAFENNCSHADKPLEKGVWNAQTREMLCPFHKAVFEVANAGRVRVGPAVVSLQVFPTQVREHNGKPTVFVGIDGSDGPW